MPSREHFIKWSKKLYVPALDFVLRYRGQTLAIVTAVVIGSFALFPFLGAEFIRRLEERFSSGSNTAFAQRVTYRIRDYRNQR